LKLELGAYLGFGICDLGFAASHALCGSHSYQLLFLEFHLVKGIDVSLGTGYDHIGICALTDDRISLLFQPDGHLPLRFGSAGDGVNGKLQQL